ncbi:methionyl-tRNA formyltransferase [Planococcus sp. CP5-4]|uniref:formyltransferase family protein n=1 Tax=unclassified Planococcus (in: firmicutes) TaxID=2662419 RepID=UPI001C24B364|nr:MULTISPECIES: formyltransferase family protein [unclassified Planococcus (in: firmicutes)]MBU9675099.1 methionyl-tRNA formyltransferase [Planococcus sp. CP5-4_YE]MBV0908058.1 methionyl-tRNA formyltransferase [Planococcus sp. CP5-4_UN]MBW6062119.1 methionyl-tRNA formyltransferase [Planococcus sp. CP5-4]
MKIAFATCVELGKSCIEEIYRLEGKLDLMITLKDEKAKNKSGRVYLDYLSSQHDIPLLKIDNINDKETIQELKIKQIDWLFIIGWSQIAKKQLLDTPNKGCIGMHPTLLPKGRGRAAIPWAIIKELDKTGVTAFKIDEGVDTGPIIDLIEIPISKDETSTTLYKKVNESHIKLMEKVWPAIIEKKLEFKTQDESEATYWNGRKPDDGEITPDSSIREADLLVRAANKPYPGSFYVFNSQTYRIWKAEFSKDVYEDKISLPLKDGYMIPVIFEIEEVMQNA